MSATRDPVTILPPVGIVSPSRVRVCSVEWVCRECVMREFRFPASGASVALRQSAASSPELSSPGSVRCVLSSCLASRSRVLRQPQSGRPEFGRECQPELSSEFVPALRPVSRSSSSAAVLRPLRWLRSFPAPQRLQKGIAFGSLRKASSETPKVIVARALNSTREAARASKVARLAERLAGIAERCR